MIVFLIKTYWWRLFDEGISINGKLSTAFQLYADEKITMHDLPLHVSRVNNHRLRLGKSALILSALYDRYYWDWTNDLLPHTNHLNYLIIEHWVSLNRDRSMVHHNAEIFWTCSMRLHYLGVSDSLPSNVRENN